MSRRVDVLTSIGFRRFSLLSWGALFCLTAGGLQAANNPSGFIQTPAWNMLFLNQGSGCNAGGPANMKGNWVAPHSIGLEDPKAGDVWADITFGSPKATGWSGAAVNASPQWLAVDATGVFTTDPTITGIPVGNIVDFAAILGQVNVLRDPDFVRDNSVALSTTYVRNNNAGPVTVGIGTTSDDGVQIYVNDLQVLTRSDCRGVLGINTQFNVITNLVDFEEVTYAVLPPGISKLTVLVWNGGGGWAMRVGLIDNGQLLNDVTGPAAGIEFLGTGLGDPTIVGQPQGADPVARNFCPFGWILTKSWNFLSPLDNPYGAEGGNTRNQLRNWTAPYDLRTENPKSGDVWAVDFARSAASGNAAREFLTTLGITDGEPIWFNLADLKGALDGIAPGLGTNLPGSGEDIDPFGRGLVDLEDMYRYISAKLKPLGIPTIDGRNCPDPTNYNTDCDPDNLLTIATSYVRNTTGADLSVRVATASDDSIVVYINSQLVTAHSLGRGSSRTPQDLRTAVLPPGISKIAVLCFEGGGGHNFRLGIRPIDSVYNYADGSTGIEFLGHGAGDDSIVGVNQFAMERLTDTGTECKDSVTVTIKGNGAGDPGQPITVIENFQAFAPEDIEISGVSAGGVMDTHVEESVYTNLSSSGGDIWADCDRFQFDYAAVSGDFDIAVEILERSHSTGVSRFGKIGLMARYDLTPSGPFAMAQDIMPELLDSARGATRKLVQGADGCDNMAEVGGFAGITAHPMFLRIKRTGSIIKFYRSNNPALADGSIDANNDVNWARFAADADGDFSAAAIPGTLQVGFANSEHGSNGTQLQRVVYRLLPSSYVGGDVSNKLTHWDASTFIGFDGGGLSSTTLGDATVGKRIVWNTTQGEVNAGLSYSIKSTNNRTSYVNYLPARRVDTGYLSVIGPPFTLGGPPYYPTPPFPPGTVGAFPYLVSGSLSGMPINPHLYEPLNDTGHLNLPLAPGSGAVGDFTDSRDIGWLLDPITPGSSAFDGTTYTIQGSGFDIWDNSDHMQFAFKEYTGDFVATARIANVATLPNTAWGRMGIMARYTCDPASKYSFACVPYTGEDPEIPDNNFSKRHQSRAFHFGVGATADAQGNTTRDQQVVPGGSVSQGVTGWVRLTRLGNYFYSQFADDVGGQPGPWVFAGGDYHPTPPDTVLLGLVSSSHGSGLLSVDYDNWSVRALKAGESTCSEVGEFYSDDFEAGILDATYAVVKNTAFSPSVISGRLRICQDGIGGQANAVWVNTNGATLADTGFKAEFDAFYGKLSGSDPADGMTFAVIQGDFSIAAGFVGDGGGGLGYNRGDQNAIPASRPTSFAVEIDAWDGGAGDNDPPGQGANGSNQDNRYHMGIDFNGEVQSAVNNVEFGKTLPVLYNKPAGIHVELLYNPADSTGTGASDLSVYVTANDGSFERTKVLSAKGPRLTGDIFMGFTGGTGGANANMEVDNFVVTELCCETVDVAAIAPQPPVNLGDQNLVTLDGSGSTGADGAFTYTWELLSGNAAFVGAPAGPMPQLQLNGSGTVKVKLTVGDGVCDDTASAQMSFDVSCSDPAEVAKITGAPATITAVGAAVTLDGSGSSAGVGDGKPFTYAWSIASGPGAIVGSSTGSSVSVKGTSPGTVTVQLVVDDGRCGNPATATASFCVDDPDSAVIVAPAGPQGVGSTVVLDSTGSSTGSRKWTVVSGPGAIVGSDSGDTVSVKGSAAGDVVVRLKVDDGICDNAGSTEKTITFAVLANWKRGDANGDKLLDISDAVANLNFQFLGVTLPSPNCPATLDFNKDGVVDISDPVALLGVLFLGKPQPDLYNQCELFSGCANICQ